MPKVQGKAHEIVKVNPVETCVKIDSNDVVALLVSRADEKIGKQEQEVKDKLKKLNDARKSLVKSSDKTMESLVEARRKSVKPLLALVKKLGGVDAVLDVTGHASYTYNKPDTFALSTVVSTSSSGVGMSIFTSVLLPKSIKLANKSIAVIDSKIKKENERLLSLRSYRQNEMVSLERHARGQIAMRAFEEIGGDMDKFIGSVADIIPARLRNLLTDGKS